MKRWLILLILLTGCGGSATSSNPKTLIISWTGDGNPSIPVCSTSRVNCKSQIQIHDMTSGMDYFVPVTDLNFIAPVSSDTYEVRTDGYDGYGNQIYSIYDIVH